MKKLMVFILVVLGILATAGAAMAQDGSFSVDYSQLSLGSSFVDNDPKIFTVSGEYTPGSLIVGFTTSALIFYRGLPSGTKEDYGVYGIYAGYNFVKNDAGSIGLVVSDMNWNFKESSGTSSNRYFTNSIGIGPKAELNLGSVDLSFAYFYGLRNKQTHNLNGTKTFDDDLRVSYFEVKSDFQLSDTMGLCVAYRHSDLDFISPSNIGVGLDWKF